MFGLTQGGIGNSNWPFADYFAPDYNPNQQGSFSLSDFFNFQAGPLSPPTIPQGFYPPDCFHHPWDSGCFYGQGGVYPSDPDNDAVETD